MYLICIEYVYHIYIYISYVYLYAYVRETTNRMGFSFDNHHTSNGFQNQVTCQWHATGRSCFLAQESARAESIVAGVVGIHQSHKFQN